ncbi:MAG: RNA methyltransferase [Lautropia sp.]
MNVPGALHPALPDALRERLHAHRIVLVSPSHPGNIGSVARAMRTMGLVDLVVVAPHDPDFIDHRQALALASGAVELLRSARTAPSLEAAIADCQMVVAVSAEPREFGPEPAMPGAVVEHAQQALRARRAQRIAWVFGTERNGLSIDEVSLCTHLATIPAEPAHASLNLSQAVQIIAFVLRQSVLGEREALLGPVTAHLRHPPGAPPPPPGPNRLDRGEALADHVSLERLFEHLERTMVAIGYLDPVHPRKMMARLRRMLLRSEPDNADVDLLRGICRAIERGQARSAGL